jgi:HEAT repeat protein
MVFRPGLAAVALLASSAFAGDPVEVRLEWSGGHPVPTLPDTLELSFAAGTGRATPPGALDPRFGSVPLRAAPSGGVTVALDLAPGRERVWVDTDLDGDLADEQHVSWEREGLRWFATADVEVPVDGGHVRLPVRMWRGAFRPDDEFLYEAAAHRWGAAPIGNALTLIAVEDVDGDLRFALDGPDRVYVDVDGDGQLDSRPGSPESIPLGGEVTLDGRRLRVDAAPDGSRLVLYDAPPRHDTVLPRAGEPVPPPDEDFDTLFELFTEQRKSPAGVRAPCVRNIGALGTREALILLELVAKDDIDLDVREIAAEALGNPAFVGNGDERVLALARSLSPRVAAGAIRALHRMDHPERQPVYSDLLLSKSPRVVEEAALHLAAIDSPAARAALVDAVSGRPEAELRRAAYRGARRGPLGLPAKARAAAAGDVHDELRLTALRDAMDDRDGRARQLLHAACEDLGPGDDIHELLPLLARCGDGACVDDIVWLGATRGRRPALALLQRMNGSVTVQRLAAALTHERGEVRAFAAEALGLRGDDRAVGRLLEALEQEGAGIPREAMLAALGDLGDVRAIGAFERATDGEGGGGPRAFYGALGTPWVRGVAEAQAAFRLGLRDPAWKVKALTLETIAAAGEPAVLRYVRDALREEHRLVRLAAAETLGEVRERASARVLLDALRDERNQPVRDAMGLALFRITGVNLYDDVGLWTQWWEEHGETFTVPEVMPSLPPAAVAGTSAPEPPKFYGIPLETESVVFVIDQSGSMAGGGSPFIAPGNVAGSKWDTAVRELLDAVEQLEDGTDVNVILFETGVRPWRRSPQRLSKATRTSLKRFLGKLQPGGATNLYDALERALRTPDIETIVLLSDGAPTHGRFIDPSSILAAVEDMNKRRGVVIHTVSIGGGSPLLRRIATQNDGEYVTK